MLQQRGAMPAPGQAGAGPAHAHPSDRAVDVLAAHLSDRNDGKDLLTSAAHQVTAAVEGIAGVAHQYVVERVFQSSHLDVDP